MNYKHGLAHTRLDNIYKSMISRCYHKNNNRYARYGARGIKVCDEWLQDKTKFFEWALANGYSEELTIDRIDYDADYEPKNCRWATQKEQQNNRINNRRIVINNVSHTAAEWADILNVKAWNIYAHRRHGNVEAYILSKMNAK